MEIVARRVGLASLDEISGPAIVQLEGSFLTWELRRDGMQDVSRKMSKYSTKGSLAAFRKLAGKPPSSMLNHQVWEFVKKWGVLGLDPYVREQERPRSAWAGSVWESSVSEAKEYNRVAESLYYSEPVSTYVDLANVFDSLLKVNAKIRAGNWRRIRRTDIYQATAGLSLNHASHFVSPEGRVKAMEGLSRIDDLTCAFQRLNDMRLERVEASRMHEEVGLIASYLSPSSYPLLISHRGTDYEANLCVLFGDWRDGCAWDRKHAAYCQQWELSSYLFSGVLNIVYDNLAPLSSGTRSRPSALYKALMFQLTLQLLPSEASAFCAYCHAEFEREEGKRKGRNGVEFCPGENDCKKNYRAAYDKKYDSRRKPKINPEK